jgi:hypothetical protein
VNVAVVLPVVTVTLDGTVATEVKLLESVTHSPATRGWTGYLTVPVDGVGPLTVVGLRVRDSTLALFPMDHH